MLHLKYHGKRNQLRPTTIKYKMNECKRQSSTVKIYLPTRLRTESPKTMVSPLVHRFAPILHFNVLCFHAWTLCDRVTSDDSDLGAESEKNQQCTAGRKPFPIWKKTIKKNASQAHYAHKPLIKYSLKNGSICLLRLLICWSRLGFVELFTSSLFIVTWVSCKFEMINKPVATILVFIHKKWQ